jgi:hypothetical protein
MPRVFIATTSDPVRRVLTHLCAEVPCEEGEKKEADFWLLDGHHPPASVPPDSARLLVLGPVPAGLTPALHLATPLRPEMLVAQLRKLAGSARVMLAADWYLDAAQRQLLHAESEPVHLTEKEVLLLQALLAQTPEAISREALLKKVWSYDEEVTSHTVETHIYRLRHKCESALPRPCEILTDAGGYRLVISPSAAPGRSG